MASPTVDIFDRWWAEKKPVVDEQIRSHLSTIMSARCADCRSETVGRVLETFRDFCVGGKMLRAAFVELGYMAAGGKHSRDILEFQAAVEIVHSARLTHDDIIDRSNEAALLRQHSMRPGRFTTRNESYWVMLIVMGEPWAYCPVMLASS